MDLQLQKSNLKSGETITISGSKSESNRLLILQQIFPELAIENLSDSDDSVHLEHALTTNDETVDIGHAGTAMRFLTGFFSAQVGKNKIVKGSDRMHNRPIGILVDALRDLGADITYIEKDGYPPIKISGKEITKDKVSINGNVSSQYISSLMLTAPSLANGLEIKLVGKITSIPYINMTLSLLHQLGIKASFNEDTIKVEAKKSIDTQKALVEADWSSASYYYSLIALASVNTEVTLTAYKEESLQGDSCLADIYKHFGVSTTFNGNAITLKKEKEHNPNTLVLDLKNAPDIAQTIAVTCFGLGVACDLTGLHTLKIKETDRLEALKAELTKLGASIDVTDETLHLQKANSITENVSIATYNDHRMAMAFAPLSLKTTLNIINAEVVTKSYRNFWSDFQKVGIQQIETK